MDSVAKGEFGLASSLTQDGTYENVWFNETVSPEEVTFESDVFLLTKARSQVLRNVAKPDSAPQSSTVSTPRSSNEPETPPSQEQPNIVTGISNRIFRIVGEIPPEIWNRLGTRILPKLRSGSNLHVGIQFSVSLDSGVSQNFETELKQILDDLELTGSVRIEQEKI